MICLKKINLEKTPFNQAYNQISNGYIQVNTINGDSLLFGNGYELIEIIGDKDLLELILNRHSKENTCDEEILDTTDLNNELELNVKDIEYVGGDLEPLNILITLKKD